MRSHVPFGSDFQVNVLLARPSHFTRQAPLPRSVNNLMLLPISYGAFGLLGTPGNVALQTTGIVALQLPAGRLMIGEGDVDGVFVVVLRLSGIWSGAVRASSSIDILSARQWWS